MDKFIDVPSASVSQLDTTVKTYMSSASTTHMYKGDIERLKAQIISQDATSDINKIN